MTVATAPAPAQNPVPDHQPSWRIRSGVARTFGSLFLALCVLLLLLGGELFYDAFAHPLTADSGQVLLGSVCVTIAFLLVAFMLRDRH